MLPPADPRGTTTSRYRYRTIVSRRLSPLHRQPIGRHLDGEPCGQRERGGAADEGTDRRGKHRGNIMPTKDVDGKPLTESKQLLDAWQEFLGRKFTCVDLPGAAYAPVTADDDDGEVTEEELEKCLRVLHDNKAPGCDGIPIEAYRGSPAAKQELFAIVRLMWKTEVIPPALVRGTFGKARLPTLAITEQFDWCATDISCYPCWFCTACEMLLSRGWPRHKLVFVETWLSWQRSAAATADGCRASGREASSGHVYRLPRCLRHHQPPLPGRVLGSCRSTAQDPPHSEGHLRWGNRDGASALTERRDIVFRTVSRPSRRHPRRYLQPAVFYAWFGPNLQAARHRRPGHWRPIPGWRDGNQARVRRRRRSARLDGSWGFWACLCTGEWLQNIRVDGDVGAQVEGHACACPGASTSVDGSGG